MAFAIVSISAPLLGVFGGGVLVDKMGGFGTPVGMATTLRTCTIFAVAAATAAILSCWVPSGWGGAAFFGFALRSFRARLLRLWSAMREAKSLVPDPPRLVCLRFMAP